MQREIRQRCGFGCVICGLPLYEYEHMLEWATVQRHVADEITLLCPTHHIEKTKGLLSKEAVSDANKNPYNLKEGVSKPYNLNYSGDECEIILGGNSFRTKDKGYETQTIPIIVDDIPLIGFIMSEGYLLLNLNLFDEFNHFAVRIVNNELVYKAELWDVEFVGRNFIVRQASRDIFIDIIFEIPNKIIINRGRLLCNGIKVEITPESAVINETMTFVGTKADNISAGIVIGRDSNKYGGIIYVKNVTRYK